MRVMFLKSFSKDIDEIKSVQVRRQLRDLILFIESVESLSEIPHIRKLRGHRQAFRIRMGEYRIGFFMEKEGLLMARILHRKDIYKKFP